ncbi:hypothetical protein [Wolbachia endosymbiont of Phyllotreta cruciferae]|uniref:hypothetical protein n=1 Tax=Wolbachia endosymbiont of Phyllotreta cruciferae TaxID=2886377 RepID=UPI00209D28D0|nr:hypothetical protein [Wolbachia endosymbiont of Phyllotreta cruciferae]
MPLRAMQQTFIFVGNSKGKASCSSKVFKEFALFLAFSTACFGVYSIESALIVAVHVYQ